MNIRTNGVLAVIFFLSSTEGIACSLLPPLSSYFNLTFPPPGTVVETELHFVFTWTQILAIRCWKCTYSKYLFEWKNKYGIQNDDARPHQLGDILKTNDTRERFSGRTWRISNDTFYVDDDYTRIITDSDESSFCHWTPGLLVLFRPAYSRRKVPTVRFRRIRLALKRLFLN